MAKLLLFFALVGVAFARTHVKEEFFEEPRVVQGREISQNLYIDNPFTASGVWGAIDLCVDGSFAFGIEVMYSPPGHLDETAINVIKLYCGTTEGADTGYVTSSMGTHGDYYGMQICSEDFITGFRANVLEDQGIFTDDVAVEDFEVDCNYGREIVDALPIPVPQEGNVQPLDFQAGTWSSFATCREGLAVCGLQTRYEDGSLGDEAAIVDVVLFCCERPVATPSPAP